MSIDEGMDAGGQHGIGHLPQRGQGHQHPDLVQGQRRPSLPNATARNTMQLAAGVDTSQLSTASGTRRGQASAICSQARTQVPSGPMRSRRRMRAMAASSSDSEMRRGRSPSRVQKSKTFKTHWGESAHHFCAKCLATIGAMHSPTKAQPPEVKDTMRCNEDLGITALPRRTLSLSRAASCDRRCSRMTARPSPRNRRASRALSCAAARAKKSPACAGSLALPRCLAVEALWVQASACATSE